MIPLKVYRTYAPSHEGNRETVKLRTYIYRGQNSHGVHFFDEILDNGGVVPTAFTDFDTKEMFGEV